MATRLLIVAAALIVSVFAGSVTGNAVVAGMGGLGEGYAPPAIGDERQMLAGLPEEPTSWTPSEQPEPGLSLASARQEPDCPDCGEPAAADQKGGGSWPAAQDIVHVDAYDQDSDVFTESLPVTQ